MHVVKQAALFVRTNFWIVPLALLLAWALFRFLDPAPPRTLVMTTGGESGGYHHFGLALKQRLAEEGLTLELRTSSGSVDNLERLSDGSGAVQLGLIQSGTTSLIEPQRLAGLESLGAIYHEPLWLFQKRDAGIARLSDLRGRQISVGSAGSGTWAVVRSVFNQLDGQAGEDELANGNWRQLPDSASARALHAGELDAAFFVLPVDNAMVRQLLADPDLELVNLGQTEALAARLPFLEKLSVAEGLFDL